MWREQKKSSEKDGQKDGQRQDCKGCHDPSRQLGHLERGYKQKKKAQNSDLFIVKEELARKDFSPRKIIVSSQNQLLHQTWNIFNKGHTLPPEVASLQS